MSQNASVRAYVDFLKNKPEVQKASGLSVAASDMHESLMGHQRDIVRWALKRERALIAASFGLGKSRIQIELMRQVHMATGRKTLVIAPLGVRQQFRSEDGPAMGVQFEYVGTDAELVNSESSYLITNYERIRDGQISADVLTEHIVAVTLDEGAILGNLGTKTQDQFKVILSEIQYRWVATATPAPNDYRQLIYFADFLGVMDAGQALTRWFGRNPDKAGDLQLLSHMEEQFWLWVASWAIFVNKPSDLGYSDEGYEMPELRIVWHRITSDHQAAWELHDRTGQAYLFKDTAAGVQQAMREKRDSMDARIAKVAEVVGDDPDAHWLIWHNLEDERRAIEKAIPTSTSVYGSQDLDKREEIILDFSHGKLPILATKPQLSGSGCNFQHYCHKAIYAGVDFKFRDFIQSVHRLKRYLQKHTVEIHIVHTDAEDHVVDVLMQKWQKHDEMVERMTNIIRTYGLTNESLASEMRRSIGVQRQIWKGHNATAVNNDCVLETMTMADDSVDCIVTSIPFGNHYEYVASLNDFGHSQTDADFWQQMDYLIPELYRILKPGRMACIHVKDRLLYGHQTAHGMMEVDPFSDDTNRAFRKHGFVSYGRITIPTDVVRENNSTYRLGWTEMTKDGSKMGVGMPEYVMLFRKPQTDKSRSYADEPVVRTKEEYSRGRWQIDAHQLWRSDGKAMTTPDNDPSLLLEMDTGQIYNWYKEWSKDAPYDYEFHVRLNEILEKAGSNRLPAKFMVMPPQAPTEYEDTVWTDILFFQTLNMQQSRKRQEKHVCPLPFDIVRRLIVRYSNPGEMILDPFGGLMTVPYVALAEGRKAMGIELNPEYWRHGCKHLETQETKLATPTLFDLDEISVNGNGIELCPA